MNIRRFGNLKLSIAAAFLTLLCGPSFGEESLLSEVGKRTSSPCPSGHFLSKACDDLRWASRECTECSQCPEGTFLATPCNATADNNCVACSSDELEVRKCDNFLSTGGNRICQENSTKPQVLLTSNSPTRGNITINSEKQASPGIESMPVLKYSAPDTGPDGAPSGNFTLIVRASSLSSLIPLFGPATAEDPEQVETAPTLVNNSTLTPDFLENATNVTTMMDEQTLNPTPFHSPTRAPVRTDDAFTFNDDFEAFVMPEKKLTNLSDAGYIDARAEDPLVTGSVRNETLPSIPVAGSSPFNITSEIWPAFNSSVEHFAPSGSFLDNQTTANATGSVLNTTNEERTDVDIDDHSVALNVSPPSNSSTTMPAMHGIGKDDHPATPDLLGESDFTSNHSDPIEAQGGADEVHPLMPDDKVYIVKGQLGIRGITPDDFAAAGLWERMKKSIASTSGRSTDLVSVASVNPIHVVVDVRVIFNHFENEESLRFSEAFDESPYEILSEEAIFALYEVQRTARVGRTETTYADAMDEAREAEEMGLPIRQAPPLMQNIAESVEAVDDETGGNAIDRISSFFEDGAAAAVGWWESLPLWQQIVVPLGAGLALAMVVGAVCSIYCCCRKKRKAREDHRHTIDFSKYGNSDAQADIRVHV